LDIAGKTPKLFHGLDRVFFAPFHPDTLTWDKPVEILGGPVKFAPQGQGTKTTIYAGNRPYYTYTKDNGDAGDLEMYAFPDEFLIWALGWVKHSSGVLLKLANRPQKPFAFMYETMFINQAEEQDLLRVLYYNMTGAKPNITYATDQEGLQISTGTMNLTGAPLNFPGIGDLTSVEITQGESPDVFETFFDEVWVPDATVIA